MQVVGGQRVRGPDHGPTGHRDARGGARARVSVNVTVEQAGSRQRQTRLRQLISMCRWPKGASCSRCSRRPCGTAKTPQPRQPSTCRSVSTVRRSPARSRSAAQDTHPGHAEHGRCRRAALSTIHLVEAFVLNQLVRYRSSKALARLRLRQELPARRRHHAQDRRAGISA